MDKISIEELHIFVTPIFKINLSQIDNSLIIKEINEIISISPGRKISNNGGHQSNDFNLETSPKTMSEVALVVLEMCKDIYRHTNINEDVRVLDFWFNVNKYKDSNFNHVHHVDGFSAVYYVKCNSDSGGIVFTRPGAEKFTARQTAPFYNEFYEAIPQEGDIFIFPSNIEHFVRPNMSNQDRISIAFNLGR